MFDTKLAIVIRNDLESWQKLNVTAFMVSGIIGKAPQIIGEPYEDAVGNIYNPLCIQPMIILGADASTLSKINSRALSRGVQSSIYIEEMFSTKHDAENREVFKQHSPDDAKIVGISLLADKKIVDKITKGAKMHG